MPHQEYIASGRANIVGKADDRNFGRACNIGHRDHIVAAQGAKDQLVAIGHRFAHCGIDAKRGVIAGHADIGVACVEQSQGGGIGNGLAHLCIGASQWQQQSNTVPVIVTQHDIGRIGAFHRGRAFVRYLSALWHHRRTGRQKHQHQQR